MKSNGRFEELVESIEETYQKYIKKEYEEKGHEIVRKYVGETLKENPNINDCSLKKQFFDEVISRDILIKKYKIYNIRRSEVIYRERLNKNMQSTIFKSEKGNYFEVVSEKNNIKSIDDLEKWDIVRLFIKKKDIKRLISYFPEEFMELERK